MRIEESASRYMAKQATSLGPEMKRQGAVQLVLGQIQGTPLENERWILMCTEVREARAD